MRCLTHAFGTPIGLLRAFLDEQGRVVGLEFARRADDLAAHLTASGGELHVDAAAGAKVERQLAEYFAGLRTDFELELAPRGTPFQLRVWEELRTIPYGSTMSYGALARRLGSATLTRAVGLANGANPIAIVVPCHRVIGADGSLVGYGGGLEVKRRLLELEGALAPSLFWNVER